MIEVELSLHCKVCGNRKYVVDLIDEGVTD